MISVCVPFYPWARSYDRSHEVFDVLLPGLNKAAHAKSLELCLTDAGVEDIFVKRGDKRGRTWNSRRFHEKLKKSFRGKTNYTLDKECIHVSEDGSRRFWLAMAVAKSVQRATYDNILIFGIDCYAPRDLGHRFADTVKDGVGWVLFAFNVPQGAPLAINEVGGKGYCWHTAKGIVGIKKKDYDKIGGYEKSLPYISTRTDSDFYNRMTAGLDKVVIRKELGLFHVGHPGSNASRYWKVEDA